MLLTALKSIPDGRRAQSKKYQLQYLIFFSILAILSNAKSYREIASFIETHFRILKKRYKLNWKDPPNYSTIRRAILSLNKVEIEKNFRSFSLKLLKKLAITGIKLVAIDGKTLRGSFNNFNDTKSIQVLSAFLANDLLILGHEEIVNDKTNEIPLAQKMIKELGLIGVVFTLDALHCQKNTLKAVVKSHNNAIIQVKDNQKNLHKRVQNLSNTFNPTDKYITKEKTRNRYERREVYVYSRLDYLKERIPVTWNQYIKCIVKVVRKTNRFNTKKKYWERSIEDSYYLSTEIYTAKVFSEDIRGHWGIENSDHYVRDYSMQEDNSRIRINPDNFSILRSFALNILRSNRKTNIKSELFKNSLSLDRLMKFNFLS